MKNLFYIIPNEDFLNSEVITSKEKGYLISLFRICSDYSNCIVCKFSNTELSDLLNLSRVTIIKYNKSLKEKGIFIDETPFNNLRIFNLNILCKDALLYKPLNDE